MPKIKENICKKRIVISDNMKIGQIGIILDEDHYGKVILRYYNGFVVLSNPEECWNSQMIFKEIELLDINEEITLIQDI